MREILFRGKRLDYGRWAEGHYFANENGTFIFIFPYHANFGGIEILQKVDPETVGQYTGLKDKNGKKIFEGDIVEYNGTIHEVIFETRCGTAYFGIKMSNIETWSFSNSAPATMMKVIGNIHDNPELLDE